MRYLIILLLTIPLNICAQRLTFEQSVHRWEADFRAGFNSTGYQMDFGVAWFPIEYAGVRASIGMTGEIGDLVQTIFSPDDDYYIDDYNDYAARFRFTPAIVLRTPRIINWSSQDAGLYLFAEPGLILSPGAAGSYRPSWCDWDVRAGINAQWDNTILTLGYEITSYNLYSGIARHTPLTHAGYIGVGYKF